MPGFAFLQRNRSIDGVFKDAFRLLTRLNQWQEAEGEIPVWRNTDDQGDVRNRFESAAHFLECRLRESARLTVVVDEVNPAQLEPESGRGWSSLLAMLILAFPEVHWAFLVITDAPSDDEDAVRRWEQFRLAHGAQTLGEAHGTALFDGRGLRRWVIERLRGPHYPPRSDDPEHALAHAHGRRATAVPERLPLAVVLDEEEDYHLFLGLMAYSHGFRVHAIASWAEAVRLLGEAPNPRRSTGRLHPEPISLTIEDWYLNFPDQGQAGLSDLQMRASVLPALPLNGPTRRRFLTVGHGRGTSRDAKRAENLARLRETEARETGFLPRPSEQVIFKPASGLFTLWKELGLPRALRAQRDSGDRAGFAPGFHWPPEQEGKDDDPVVHEAGDHSSPGRLLQIAEHLLERAAGMSESARTVKATVRGAVLATQALELLTCRTPTLSVEALMLRHEFEVAAECQFSGVEYHLSMDERLRDIEKNLTAMSRWLHRGRRRQFVYNAEAKIVSRLVAMLNRYGEFEESEFCQRRLRRLHRLISQHNDMRRGQVLKLALWPINLYVDWVLRSLVHFAFTIVVMVLILGVLFWLAGVPTFPQSLHYALWGTLTVSLPDPFTTESELKPWLAGNIQVAIVGYLSMTVGLLNFGLLVTHLYAKMARK